MEQDDGVASPQYQTRELQKGDVALLRRVNCLFSDAFDDHERYQADLPGDEHLCSVLASPAFIGLVAMNEGEIVGAVTAYELVKCERETKEIFLYDLAVASPRRRGGVASALIEHLRRIARDRGADVVFVQSDFDDAGAAALYARFARRQELLHFDILPAGTEVGVGGVTSA